MISEGFTEEDAEDRKLWRSNICLGLKLPNIYCRKILRNGEKKCIFRLEFDLKAGYSKRQASISTIQRNPLIRLIRNKVEQHSYHDPKNSSGDGESTQARRAGDPEFISLCMQDSLFYVILYDIKTI